MAPATEQICCRYVIYRNEQLVPTALPASAFGPFLAVLASRPVGVARASSLPASPDPQPEFLSAIEPERTQQYRETVPPHLRCHQRWPHCVLNHDCSGILAGTACAGRFGSTASILTRLTHVRFTPESGARPDMRRGPGRAITGSRRSETAFTLP